MKKISTLFNSVKEKSVATYNSLKKNALGILSATAVGVPAMSMLNVHAIDPEDLMWDILDIIFDIFLYIGILLLAWSVGMLVLAFKNEDADSKSRAMMMLVVSIVLIGLKALVEPIAKSVIGPSK